MLKTFSVQIIKSNQEDLTKASPNAWKEMLKKLIRFLTGLHFHKWDYIRPAGHSLLFIGRRKCTICGKTQEELPFAAPFDIWTTVVDEQEE